MEKYSIVFASDKNYIEHLSVALVSLIINNLSSNFDVYILNSGIPFKIWKKLNNTIANYNVKLINVILNENIFENLIINHHFSKANYYRLLIPELIKLDKVLYLDSDIVINGSIKELYDLNIDDFYVAAVEDPTFDRHNELKMSKNSKYFNSGVMLINNKKWRDDKLSNRVIDFIKDNTEVIRFVDQCGLNGVVDGNWMPIPLKYNQQSIIFEDCFLQLNHSFTVNEIDESIKNPIIVHYTGSSKPWDLRNNHPYKFLYTKYSRQTSFKSRYHIKSALYNILKTLLNKLKIIINLNYLLTWKKRKF